MSQSPMARPPRPLAACAALGVMALCLVLLSVAVLVTLGASFWLIALVPLIGAIALGVEVIDVWTHSPSTGLAHLEQRVASLEIPGGSEVMLEPETRRALQLMYRTLLAESKEAISKSLSDVNGDINHSLGRFEGAITERLSRTQAELVRLSKIEKDLLKLDNIERELGKLDQMREELRKIGGLEPHIDRLYEIQAQLRLLSDIERDLTGLKQGQEKLTQSAEDLKDQVRAQGEWLDRIERGQSPNPNPLQVIPGGLQAGAGRRPRGPRRLWETVPFDTDLMESWKRLYEDEAKRGIFAMAPFWYACALDIPRAFTEELNKLDNDAWTDTLSVKEVVGNASLVLAEAARALENRDYLVNVSRMEAVFPGRDSPISQGEAAIKTAVAAVVSSLSGAGALSLQKTTESVDDLLDELSRRMARGGLPRVLAPVSFSVIQAHRHKAGANISSQVSYALLGHALAEYLQEHYGA